MCISCYCYFKSCLKLLYINNETECFSYKGGCNICMYAEMINCLKECLIKIMIFAMLLKTVIYTTKELNNKAVLKWGGHGKIYSEFIV